MNRPTPIKLDELSITALQGMLQSLNHSIDNVTSICDECQPPPNLIQARDNVENEIASRGL